MTHKAIFTFILFLVSIALNAQPPFSEEIETDSSKIEIIRNSVYRVYKEEFKHNDSVWYNVTYIDDTTQLNTEGWHTKGGRYLGTWKEFNRQGKLMYTWNHDKGTCTVNPKMYPYHDLLVKMKTRADKLIIDAYGKDFYDNHVKFNYNCYAYHGHWDVFGNDTMWMEDYLGSWTEPLKGRPNSYLLRYEVRLNKKDDSFIELGIDLDSNGKYTPSGDDVYNNYGFEKLDSKNKNFLITKEKAIKVAKQKGLQITDSSEISEFLTWDNFKKKQFYNGQFRYYITDLRKKEPYERSNGRKGVIFRYNVYTFNPWTGDFVEMKKMKSRREWGQHSGHSTGLMDDND